MLTHRPFNDDRVLGDKDGRAIRVCKVDIKELHNVTRGGRLIGDQITN